MSSKNTQQVIKNIIWEEPTTKELKQQRYKEFNEQTYNKSQIAGNELNYYKLKLTDIFEKIAYSWTNIAMRDLENNGSNCNDEEYKKAIWEYLNTMLDLVNKRVVGILEQETEEILKNVDNIAKSEICKIQNLIKKTTGGKNISRGGKGKINKTNPKAL